MWPDGSGAHDAHMLNFEITQTLAYERQTDLVRQASASRLARLVRQARRHAQPAAGTADVTIVLPAPATRDHAVAA